MAKRKISQKQAESTSFPVQPMEERFRTIYNKVNQKIELCIGGKMYILLPGGSARIPENSVISDDVKQYVK